ncbi:hypothetical protein ACS0TY_007687 [Phlomoides rotata]
MEAIRRRTVGIFVFALTILWLKKFQGRNRHQRRWCLLDMIPGQIRNMNELVGVSDEACKNMLRMDQVVFSRLCSLLQDLVDSFEHILGNKMEGAGVVGGQDGEKGKVTRGRRTWSKIEEDALIQCLTDIINNEWKADNCFKLGFQRELEKEMKKLLPGTDLVANPHINSKIHVWKKEYGSLFELLSKFGIGWNYTTNTINVLDEEEWETKKRADPHVKTMCYKSWPYYSFWQEIFGKDRAT